MPKCGNLRQEREGKKMLDKLKGNVYTYLYTSNIKRQKEESNTEGLGKWFVAIGKQVYKGKKKGELGARRAEAGEMKYE